jgi:hypothetical protein
MKSATLNSALFTELDDSQSEAVNGGSYCYYEKPKHCYYEKPKKEYCYYEKPKYYCYYEKPKSCYY